MQFIKLVSLISFIAATGLVFPKSANAAIRNLGNSMRTATDDTAHNAIIITKDGRTKTFRNSQLKPGRAMVINEATGNEVDLPRGALTMVSNKKANPALQPLFAVEPEVQGPVGGVVKDGLTQAVVVTKNNRVKMGLIGAGLVGSGALGGAAIAASDRGDFEEFEQGQF
jgi:hypothetical protein